MTHHHPQRPLPERIDPDDIRHRLRARQVLSQFDTDDEGAATAEYAIVIMAGVALAGVLVAIMRSGEVQGMLLDLVQRALGTA